MSTLTYSLIQSQVRIKQLMAVGKAVLTKQISFYPKFLEDFEQRFAKYSNKQYALSFCNGTSAIEAALFAANVKQGDEVIVPSCTFHASIDPIVNAGAVPVFADVDQSFTICPLDVARKITPYTKAIIVVHLFGIPADMDALVKIAKERNITLIEDVSHAHGARWGDQLCGSIGDYGAFSLQGSKTVASGEGGIVVTNHLLGYIRMSMWGHFTRHADLFFKIDAEEFRFTGVGFKRRMHPLGALLANADLDHINQINKIKLRHAEMLDQEMADLDGFEFAKLSPQAVRGSFYEGYPIHVTQAGASAADAINALQSAGIPAKPFPFPLHHKLSIYTDPRFREACLKQEVAIPSENSEIILPMTESLKKNLFLLPTKLLITLNQKSIKQIKHVLKSL
ncbi:MAG: DegT/DnrJ/EryC1/StrS aminotransferase family protein [Thainema sp.]